jgi:multiple antibiotic resistance protein
MAIRATVIATIVLVFFAVAGNAMLAHLGVGLPAFRIAGGVLLFLLAVDMVFARQSGLRSATASEQAEAEHRADISVFPLGIPLIAGPGAMTTVLLLTSGHLNDTSLMLGYLGVLLAVLTLTAALLLMAPWLMRLLGETGANVVSRVLGLVLAALAVQLVIDGAVASLRGAGVV